MEANTEPKSLQRLLAEPKGKITFLPGQAFLLHVFWEAPDMAAAEKVLAALARCADATHRDTPCVPTYYFRISALDADLVSKRPSTIGQHRQLGDAFKKLKVGVPRPAVEVDLVRRGIDPKLLDADLDSPLPEPMQEKPVMLEFTELYLDERSFYEHAGSRDYLDAYSEALKPGLQNTQTTIRLGTPTSEIADKILGPMLNEKVVLIPTGCALWRRPVAKSDAGSFVSIDATGSVDEVVGKLPAGLREDSTTCVGFAHPLREGTVRVLCFLPDIPSPEALQDLRAVGPKALEVHCNKTRCDTMQRALASASLDGISVIRSIQSGYIIHGRAHEVMEEC